jgi:hypothetical protein
VRPPQSYPSGKASKHRKPVGSYRLIRSLPSICACNRLYLTSSGSASASHFLSYLGVHHCTGPFHMDNNSWGFTLILWFCVRESRPPKNGRTLTTWRCLTLTIDHAFMDVSSSSVVFVISRQSRSSQNPHPVQDIAKHPLVALSRVWKQRRESREHTTCCCPPRS